MNMGECNDTDLEALLKEVFKSTNEDKNYNARKGLIELLPAGSGLSVFYAKYITNPAQERLRNFLEVLVNELNKMKDTVNDFSIESLESNPLFTTMLIRSFEIARRDHQKEKLEPLKNLVLNSLFQNTVKEDIELVFLDLISELKVSHLYFLHLLHEPNKVEVNSLNELENNKSLYAYCLKQLIDKGLVFFEGFYKRAEAKIQEEDQLHSALFPSPLPLPTAEIPFFPQERSKRMEVMLRESDGTLRDFDLAIKLIKRNQGESYTTEFGKLFIKFIKSPLEDAS
jgi:hypothetical protein